MWMAEDEEALLQCCACRVLLQDPLLLCCLHNICSKCYDKECCVKGGSTLLICPACNHETVMGVKKENLFVAGQVSELQKLKDASRCSICVQKGKADEIADEWCSKCQMSMCGQCSSKHYLHNRDHWPTSLAEVRSIGDLFETSAHRCRRHGKTYDLMCWTCQVPTCMSCAEECYQSKHEVEILNTQRTWDHFEKIKENICLIQAGLISKRKVLRHCKNVISELDAAQVKDMNELQANKRAAVESLSRAYKAAEAALKEHYSRLHEKALELKHSIELMDVRLGHAAEYSRYLAASEDKIGLLHQEPVLLSSLQALVKELDEIRAPQDATKFVTIVRAMSENLDSHMSAWIGTPTLLTDELCCTDELIAKLEMDVKGCFPQVDSSQSEQNGDVAGEVPDLGPASSAFQTPVRCRDVAVSWDGCRLLLAADNHGLLEYDMSGAELSRWRPVDKRWWAKTELVTAVEALQEGRVAVCLHFSQSVALLTQTHPWQKGDAWCEYKRITGLQIEPTRLSAHADIIAVAGTGTEELPYGNSRLLLLSLSSGQVLRRDERGYDIRGMVVTAEAVLTASGWWRVKLSDGRKGWVVDARSHDGHQLLWRQEWGSRVYDMCAAPSGRVVYVCASPGDRVTAVRAQDSSVIRDVLTSSSHGLKSSKRLSMGGRGQETALAVLSRDWTTVKVYKATPGEREHSSSTHLSCTGSSVVRADAL